MAHEDVERTESDQGGSRTLTPSSGRVSEARVYTSSTTWPKRTSTGDWGRTSGLFLMRETLSRLSYTGENEAAELSKKRTVSPAGIEPALTASQAVVRTGTLRGYQRQTVSETGVEPASSGSR